MKLKVNEYEIMEDAVEAGIVSGIRLAFEMAERGTLLSEEHLLDDNFIALLSMNIMHNVCENFELEVNDD